MVAGAVSRETMPGPAVVVRETPAMFLAWCELCGDGGRSHRRVEADNWAAKHNKERHNAGA